MKKIAIALSFLLLCMIIAGYAIGKTVLKPDEEVIYQVSTINALASGLYDGQVSLTEIQNRGDLGIGTFAALDGEMILIDGVVYQARYEGTVVAIDDQEKTPFAIVTFFNEDDRSEDLKSASYESLQRKLDSLITNPNLFYAFYISGDFSYIQVRSVPPQEKPYPLLVEVTKNQPTFEYENVKGSLIGFWCPDYVNGINVPGYHLHFISDDRTQGGHLLEVSIKDALVLVDRTPSFQMTLPDDHRLAMIDLGEDKSEEIESIEK
ncbi:MAG: acetolactate decarboxylase [Clostridia bacterium]|nr:acetolactate decarboxylase [Clostridia bacterium]